MRKLLIDERKGSFNPTEKTLIVGENVDAKLKVLKEITDGLSYYVSVVGFMISDFCHLDSHNKPIIATCNKLFDEFMIHRFDKIIFLKNTDKFTVETAKSLFDKNLEELEDTQYIVYNNSSKEISHVVHNDYVYTDLTNIKKHYS